MPWSWTERHAMSAAHPGRGGTGAGSVTETERTSAWPGYEADYLKYRLQTRNGKYDAEALGGAYKDAYLQHVVDKEQVQLEADECLKAEFKQWLAGNHEKNIDGANQVVYANTLDGAPVRKHVVRSKDGDHWPTEQKDDWRPTPWGRDSLHHLPGVREWLRAEEESSYKNDLRMQLLAEYGPQDVNQAWQYFKHWVKRRPLTESPCVVQPVEYGPKDGNRAAYGNMPHHMKSDTPATGSQTFTTPPATPQRADPQPQPQSQPLPPLRQLDWLPQVRFPPQEQIPPQLQVPPPPQPVELAEPMDEDADGSVAGPSQSTDGSVRRDSSSRDAVKDARVGGGRERREANLRRQREQRNQRRVQIKEETDRVQPGIGAPNATRRAATLRSAAERITTNLAQEFEGVGTPFVGQMRTAGQTRPSDLEGEVMGQPRQRAPTPPRRVAEALRLEEVTASLENFSLGENERQRRQSEADAAWAAL